MEENEEEEEEGVKAEACRVTGRPRLKRCL